MLGTWAETAEQCAAKDKTNIVIQPAKYRDGGGDCASCRPNAPFAELVRPSRTSIADEMREEHRRRVLGE